MDTTLRNPTTHDHAATSQRTAWDTTPDTRTLPETVRGYLPRLVEKVGNTRFSAHLLVLQPDHLIAYAEGNDVIFTPDAAYSPPRDTA